MAASYQTLAGLYADCRFVTNTDSTTLIDADLLLLANKYYGLIFRELVNTNENICAEISYTDTVSGQQEYPMPVDDTSSTYGGGAVKILRVEASYDGTNYYVASPFSITDRQHSTIGNTDASINNYYSKYNPNYAYFDRSVWLYPIPDAAVTKGIYLFWIKRPSELTGTSSTPNLPKDFLSILSEGMLIDIYRRFAKVAESDRARTNFTNMINLMKRSEVQESEPLVFRPNKDLSDYK